MQFGKGFAGEEVDHIIHIVGCVWGLHNATPSVQAVGDSRPESGNYAIASGGNEAAKCLRQTKYMLKI